MNDITRDTGAELRRNHSPMKKNRALVNWQTTLGGSMAAAGTAILAYGLHRGDDFVLAGAILSGVGSFLAGVAARDSGKSSQDNGIR